MAAKNYVCITGFNEYTKIFAYETLIGLAFNEQDSLWSQEDFKLKTGDTVYFMPGCTIPRFKIRDVLKQFGACISKRLEDATVIVGGPQTIASYTRSKHFTWILKTHFMEFLRREFSHSTNAQRLMRELRDSDADHVIMEWRTILYQLTTHTSFDEDPDWFSEMAERKRLLDEDYSEAADPENPVRSGNILIAIDDNPIALKFLKGELKVVDQDPFLKIININSVVMNREMFEEVRVMFQSPDDSNTVLAMEIMANCNYEKSFLYLALLLKEFGKKKIAEQKVKNHVNFKALLNFIGIRNYENGVTIDDITSAMTKKKLLTRSTLSEIMPIVQSEMAVELKSGNFQNTITPTKQLEDQLVDEPQVEIVEETKEQIELEPGMISPDFEL